MVKKYFCLLAGLTFLIGSNTFSQEKDSLVISTITIVEDKPIFNGNLKEFISNNIKYPQKAKIDSIEGTVFISFWVDTTGNTVNHKVIRGIREDLNKEAIRVTKLIKFKEPAMQRNKPIKVRYTVPVDFEISTKKENKEKECEE